MALSRGELEGADLAIVEINAVVEVSGRRDIRLHGIPDLVDSLWATGLSQQRPELRHAAVEANDRAHRIV